MSEPAGLSTPPMVSPTTSAELAEVEASSVEEYVPDLEPKYERLNNKLLDQGLVLGGYEDMPVQYVDETCESLREYASGANQSMGLESTESLFLRNQIGMNGDQFAEALATGIPELCPRFKVDLGKALIGTADVDSGSYGLGSGPTMIAPGTWRATEAAYQCYWERTSASGDIIDNNMVTHAMELTVTVAQGDGSVSFENCPIMEFVG